MLLIHCRTYFILAEEVIKLEYRMNKLGDYVLCSDYLLMSTAYYRSFKMHSLAYFLLIDIDYSVLLPLLARNGLADSPQEPPRAGNGKLAALPCQQHRLSGLISVLLTTTVVDHKIRTPE
ncbi:hypothetical protein AXW59_04130 [Yersinia ruckeri]|nr:hypothetical protein AXW59_04130 [Yersinia ruckeri]OJB95263.1 hypothetical protein AXW58_04140 [Yersinia ruckeri]OJB98880.1 hypothetical protein AXW57_04130 [Yersinia ruckeri]